MRLRLLSNQRGTALVAVFILTLLLIASVITIQKWTAPQLQAETHRQNVGKALSYAEGGISQAMDALRSPQAVSKFAVGNSTSTTFLFPDGRADVSMKRDDNDSSLIQLVSTGIVVSGTKAPPAIIQETIRSRSVGNFFAVVPNTLQIAFGTDLSQSSVYARDLIFQLSKPGVVGPTKVGQAFYTNSVQPGGAIDATLVQFQQNPGLQRLNAEPNLVALNTSMRGLYRSWAGSALFSAGQDVSSTLHRPSNANGVYFCPGDLTLATSPSGLTVDGFIVIYVAGTATIKGNIVPSDANVNSWVALIAENGIVLDGAAPTNMALNGTFVTGGAFNAAVPPSPRVGGQLSFSGGFQAQGGANFAQGWPARVYQFKAPSPSMPLPFFLSVEDYRVVQGKFNQ